MKPIIALFGLLAALSGYSQESSHFIVMQVSGNVLCTTGQSRQESLLVGGERLDGTSTLQLESGAQVDLLFQKNSIRFSKPGKYALADYMIETPKKGGTWSFFQRFYDFINEGISNTGNQKSVEKYHERYISKSSGGIRGFAGGAYGIQILSPVTGKLEASPKIFSWRSAGDSLIYDFQIFDYQSDGLLYKAVLKDTIARVDFQALALENGRKYYWMIERKQLGQPAPLFTLSDDPGQRSPKVEFIIQEEAVAQALAELAGLEEYQALEDDFQKLLMTAVFMEEKQLIHEAFSNYEALKAYYPENPLVQKVFGAFLIRQGLLVAGQTELGE